MTYDASGQMRLKYDKPVPTQREDKLLRYNNGDGRELKRVVEKCVIFNNDPTCTWDGLTPTYYVRSTVLGGEVIAEVHNGGQKGVRYVRAGGVILAHLKENPNWGQGGLYDAAYFEQTDAAGMSFRTTKHQAPFGYGDYSDLLQAEFDPASANVGTVTTYNPPPGPPNDPPIPLENESPLYINGEFVSATVDGVSMNWHAVRNMLNSGTALPSALSHFQGLPGFSFGEAGPGTYTYDIPGYFFETPNGPGRGDIIQVGSYGFQPSRSGIVNFSSYSFGGDDCKPGRPCAKPRPTPTPQPLTVSAASTSCDKIVQQMVFAAEVGMGAGRVRVGQTFLGLAWSYANGNDGGRALSIDGFKSALTDWGQRGHVYRHIFAHAGARMIGNEKVLPSSVAAHGLSRILPNETGYQLSSRELAADIAQLNDPEHEQETAAEINGTNAGRRVGDLLHNAMNSTKPNWGKTTEQIRKLLCN